MTLAQLHIGTLEQLYTLQSISKHYLIRIVNLGKLIIIYDHNTIVYIPSLYKYSGVPHTVYRAAGVTITNTPPVTIGGSMLTFTCSGDNEVRTSTCGSSGWSPDPGTVDCGSPVTGIIHGQVTQC